jgi:peroxiredoxin
MTTSPYTHRWRLSIAAAVCATLALGAPSRALEPGQAAPALEARALDGKSRLSLAAYRGRVVYLDFWASWCGPCASSLPALDALRKEFSPDDFQVLAVNVDSDPKQGRSFLSRRPVGYPSVSDPKGELPERFGVETMPTSYLIDRDGTIRYVHKGFRRGDVDELRSRIRQLVGKP